MKMMTKIWSLIAFLLAIGPVDGFLASPTKLQRRFLASSKLDASDYDYEEGETKTRKGRRRIIRVSRSSAKKAEVHRQEAKKRHHQALKDPTLLTNVKFEEREDIHPATKRALVEVMGLQAMTEIQSKTYAEGKFLMAVISVVFVLHQLIISFLFQLCLDNQYWPGLVLELEKRWPT